MGGLFRSRKVGTDLSYPIPWEMLGRRDFTLTKQENLEKEVGVTVKGSGPVVEENGSGIIRKDCLGKHRCAHYDGVVRCDHSLTRKTLFRVVFWKVEFWVLSEV